MVYGTCNYSNVGKQSMDCFSREKPFLRKAPEFVSGEIDGCFSGPDAPVKT